MPHVPSVAVIGSYKQHYEDVRRALRTFAAGGWTINHPAGTDVLVPDIPFVRFESDNPAWSDPMVQTIALHRILRSDLTYVVAPSGYVGKTTSYEIGRIVQARQPLYFSAQPDDLPIDVPHSHVMDPATLIEAFPTAEAAPLFANEGSDYAQWEERLLTGDYFAD